MRLGISFCATEPVATVVNNLSALYCFDQTRQQMAAIAPGQALGGDCADEFGAVSVLSSIEKTAHSIAIDPDISQEISRLHLGAPR